MDQTQLKPCPFCGGDAELREQNFVGHPRIFVSCTKCKSVGQIHTEGHTVAFKGIQSRYISVEECREKAIGAWNKRGGVKMSDLAGELRSTQEIAEQICRILLSNMQQVPKFPDGKVPVAVAARVMGKSPLWIRRKMAEGKLPIGICEKSETCNQLDVYINPKLFWEYTGYAWKGEKK